VTATALPSVLIAALAAAAAVAPAAAAPAPRPWATVNLCDPPQRPGAVGVRVGMPAGPGAQWMRVQIEYFDAAAGRYRAAAGGGDGGWTRLGRGVRGVRGGTTFGFAVPAPGHQLVLRGRVSLQWRRGARILRSAQVLTHGGHGADAGGTSLAQCLIRR
jgi:hypothetical protein